MIELAIGWVFATCDDSVSFLFRSRLRGHSTVFYAPRRLTIALETSRAMRGYGTLASLSSDTPRSMARTIMKYS
jgi:hypothetical protein